MCLYYNIRQIFVVLPSRILLFLLILLFLPLSGCTRLFSKDDRRTVSLGVTVPETPPPAAVPLKTSQSPATDHQIKPKQPINSNLLPSEEPSQDLPSFYIKRTQPLLSLPDQRKSEKSDKADIVVDKKIISEDTLWRGTVLIKNDLIVAPQATLRLEAGTVVRFSPGNSGKRLLSLVVQGRIVCAGTSERPVIITSVYMEPHSSDWGGIILLGSEKRNSFEHCRISGSVNAIEARHSSLLLKGVKISDTILGVSLHDSTCTIQSSEISRADTALHLVDSELETRDMKLRESRVGLLGLRSSFTINTSVIQSNAQEGLLADNCRFRIASSHFLNNRSGAFIKSGEGQILQSSFSENRENGLSLIGTKARIQNSSFKSNIHAGILLDGARGSVSGSMFSKNRYANIISRGNESFSAILNYWDIPDEKQIETTIKINGSGFNNVPYSPFLQSRPPLAP